MNRLKVLQETVSSGEEAAFVILSRLSGGKGRDVKLPRISIVQYLNTAPLVHGFVYGP